MLITRHAPGDRDKAQLPLGEALTTYQKLGMKPAAASAAALTLECSAP